MAQNSASLSAGDQANRVAYRSSQGDLNQPTMAWAMVSGDSFLVTSLEPNQAGPRPPARPSVRTDRRRMSVGGRSPSRQGRFSPYPIPGVKLDLLRSVLQQRLVAMGTALAARISA
ncbi:uncharacterized protein C11orf71 homolog [Microtus ochrogaster]|uniref:Uncharacterized protein C11orf71 homolog n=1 Tax=Microtus ochrogaster TaxID=79684 RepID=A0A8J6KJW7_MICOH|nr:uncharacterized protein C11orf71 homolog [Microtus ochrogaster]KAH0500725.1 hypothetical protein LTLLF_200220 [Microtus ochrogaster]